MRYKSVGEGQLAKGWVSGQTGKEPLVSNINQENVLGGFVKETKHSKY